MSALPPKADMCGAIAYVRFSNRPFEVKRFQTIHHSSVDVACGLVLLFGLGAKALPVWDSKTRWNNLSVGLAVRPTAGSSGHTNSPHPSSREGHHSTVRWSCNIDSKSRPRTQFRFKYLAVRIRLLRLGGSLTTFSTVSALSGNSICRI